METPIYLPKDSSVFISLLFLLFLFVNSPSPVYWSSCIIVGDNSWHIQTCYVARQPPIWQGDLFSLKDLARIIALFSTLTLTSHCSYHTCCYGTIHSHTLPSDYLTESFNQNFVCINVDDWLQMVGLVEKGVKRKSNFEIFIVTVLTWLVIGYSIKVEVLFSSLIGYKWRVLVQKWCKMKIHFWDIFCHCINLECHCINLDLELLSLVFIHVSLIGYKLWGLVHKWCKAQT